MDEAREALGDYRMSTRFMYNGPNAHLITYPVTEKHLNVMLAIHDPNPWRAGEEKHTAVGLKKEALEPLKDWHPTVRAVVDLMPDQMGKWAIFDNFAHPAPFYSKGSVCMAGDAAHAVGPHLGAGAGFGMEDALVLTILIEAADQSASIGSGRSRADLCHQMLQAYNDARYERTQWLVQKTREACDLFQRRFPGVGSDPDRFGEEISWRFRHIWNFDAEAQAKEAVLQLQRTLAQTTE